MRKITLVILLKTFCLTLNAQIFLNGDFENNTSPQCQVNIPNAVFNSYFTNVKGFGSLESLDIFNFIDCPTFGTAQSGNYCISLENTSSPTESTAFSLTLQDSLQIGQPYSFCYFDRDLGDSAGPVELGLSVNDSTFGTLIYTSPTANITWTQRTVTFIAPLTGKYITARYQLSSDFTGLFIDNFGPCPTSVNENPSGNFCTIFPNPATDRITISFTEKTDGEITLFDHLGREIRGFTVQDSGERYVIDVSDLGKGVYVVEINIKTGVHFRKFIKG